MAFKELYWIVIFRYYILYMKMYVWSEWSRGHRIRNMPYNSTWGITWKNKLCVFKTWNTFTRITETEELQQRHALIYCLAHSQFSQSQEKIPIFDKIQWSKNKHTDQLNQSNLIKISKTRFISFKKYHTDLLNGSVHIKNVKHNIF